MADPEWDLDRPAIPEDLFRRPDPVPQVTPDDDLYRPAGEATDPEATAVRPVPPPMMPPPAWAYRPGTPEADLLPSERPYVSQAPVATVSRGGLTGARGVIILLAILVIAAIVGGFLWFADGGAPGAGSSPTKSSSVSSSASGGKASGTPSSAQSASGTPSVPPSDAFPPAGSALCSGSTTVAVNSAASCPFALNVAAAIPADASGSFTVTANSPATNKDYDMACVKGTYTVCTGGQNAVVYVK